MIGEKFSIKALISKINDNGSLDMLYWYDKIGTSIEVNGSLINGTLTLVENDYHSEAEKRWIPRANISAQVTNNKVEGFWVNYKTKQRLRFTLETY